MRITPRLSCNNAPDLLSVPAVMLGFFPMDSCVVLATQSDRVQMCARLDLHWFVDGYDVAVDSIRTALGRIAGCEVFLLGYARVIDDAIDSVEAMACVVGAKLRRVYVTDAERYWDIDVEDPMVDAGTAWDWAASQVTASAVYHGMSVAPSREEFVKGALDPPREHPLIPQAEAHVAALADPMAELAALTGTPDRLDEFAAARLAVLLEREECAAELMVRLNVADASRLRRRLSEARRTVRGHRAVNAVALLGVASWLDGQGAIAAQCLTQLVETAPCHPLTALLEMVHQEALPPGCWEPGVGLVG